MSGNIVSINRTGNLYPRYRPAPERGADIIILPVIRIERSPPRRRLDDIVTPGTAARVRRELERLKELETPDCPSDTNIPVDGQSLKGPRPYSKRLPSPFLDLGK